MKIPAGDTASYADADGYTVTIVAFATRLKGNANIPFDPSGHGRAGKMYITNPRGKSVFAGYWMDFPEKGWKLRGVDLQKDWDQHVTMHGDRPKKKKWWDAVWYQIPLKKRMEREVKWQALNYESLADQFAERSSGVIENTLRTYIRLVCEVNHV